ncbi:MAG: XdhC family protein, partial [Alphaproteobacteria bacterium]
MDDDLAVLAEARSWLAEGARVALASVVETWGSAPRAAGAHLAIRADSVFTGSVSGGCVEGDVIADRLSVTTIPHFHFMRLHASTNDGREDVR